MKQYLKLMRVHHYLKNGLIFLPLLFSGRLFEKAPLLQVICGFAAFCLTASAVYIINDIRDVEHDRSHTKKSKRPIASGAVPVFHAVILCVCLLGLAAIMNILSGSSPLSWLYLCIYLGINVLYSMGLKNIPLLDIAILVTGFVIRVLYGSCISGIALSHWMYLTVISMSFYLGLGKRRNEINKEGETGRKVLRFYNHDFLDKNMYMCLGLTIAFYALWSVDPGTVARPAGQYIVWTVPIIMLICMKYSLNIEGDSHGDPVDVILGDRTLMALAAVYMVIMFGLIYLLPLMMRV